MTETIKVMQCECGKIVEPPYKCCKYPARMTIVDAPVWWFEGAKPVEALLDDEDFAALEEAD